MKLYEIYVKFVNNVLITLSDEQMTKIKVVDLDNFYNFYVYDFLAEIIYCLKMLFEVVIFWNSNFELIEQSHIKMAKIIVVRTQEMDRAWF